MSDSGKQSFVERLKGLMTLDEKVVEEKRDLGITYPKDAEKDKSKETKHRKARQKKNNSATPSRSLEEDKIEKDHSPHSKKRRFFEISEGRFSPSSTPKKRRSR